MKEGQIYEYEGKERFVLTNISSKRLCAIYQSGIVINLERFSPQMKVYGKLIAEYPIWQQAVNSKEFKNIDCGKAGYKTPREIKLEKKLEIAVKALETVITAASFGKIRGINIDTPDNLRLKSVIRLAQQALKEIEE